MASPQSKRGWFAITPSSVTGASALQSRRRCHSGRICDPDISKRGRTLAALATECGINASALTVTVARYNSQTAAGVDADFHKGETAYNRIRGDAKAWWTQPNPAWRQSNRRRSHAVRVVPGSLGTFAGLVTDNNAQVLDSSGAPIGGLYACGNDMNSIMGGRYPSGGITLGPAMTFGYLAADMPRRCRCIDVRNDDVCLRRRRLNQPILQNKDHLYYEIATMTLPFGTAAQAASQVQTFCSAPEAGGELLGCWFTDIGTLNQMLVLRGFP